eukprot:10858933-Heterocapsa_arctica.AAC.1
MAGTPSISSLVDGDCDRPPQRGVGSAVSLGCHLELAPPFPGGDDQLLLCAEEPLEDLRAMQLLGLVRALLVHIASNPESGG